MRLELIQPDGSLTEKAFLDLDFVPNVGDSIFFENGSFTVVSRMFYVKPGTVSCKVTAIKLYGVFGG